MGVGLLFGPVINTVGEKQEYVGSSAALKRSVLCLQRYRKDQRVPFGFFGTMRLTEDFRKKFKFYLVFC